MSMWSQSPMMYNAGSVATGEEDYSFFTNFRYQWFTVGNKPMRTNILNASFKIPDGFLGSNNFGIGNTAANDQTGDIGFMTTAVSVPINYTMALDRRNKLSVVLVLVFINKVMTLLFKLGKINGQEEDLIQTLIVNRH